MSALSSISIALHDDVLTAAVADTTLTERPAVEDNGLDPELTLDEIDSVRDDLEELLQSTDVRKLLTLVTPEGPSPIKFDQLSFDRSYSDDGLDGVEVNVWLTLPAEVVGTGDTPEVIFPEYLNSRLAWIKAVRHDELDHTNAATAAISLLHIGMAHLTYSIANILRFIDRLNQLTPPDQKGGHAATSRLDGVLDPASIRAEIEEAPEDHDLDTDEAHAILALGDDALTEAINAAISSNGDQYWSTYDSTRRDAIAKLRQQADQKAEETP